MSELDDLIDDEIKHHCECGMKGMSLRQSNCACELALRSAARAELAAMREELALWKSKHGMIERALEAEKKLRSDDNATSRHTFFSQSAKIDRLMQVIARADEFATDVSCVVDRNPNKYDCEVDYKDIEAMRDGRDAYRAARESVK